MAHKQTPPLCLQRAVTAIFVAVTLFAATLLFGAEPHVTVSGAKFARQANVGGKTLQLNGTALFEVTFLNIDIWVGALYTEKATTEARQVTDQMAHKRVALHYLRGAGKSRLQDGWTDFLDDQPNAEKWKDEIRAFAKLWPKIESGDRVVFDYIPAKPMTMTHNGKQIAVVRNQAFSNFIFASWVGKGANDQVRRGFLAGK